MDAKKCGDEMIEIDDVFKAANQITADLPSVGEVWQQVDGSNVIIIGISTNKFGPLEVRNSDGSHGGFRCRDGRYVIFGVRGNDPMDLILRVSS